MPGSIDAYLGNRVRELRKRKGWTQADLGSFVGLRFQQIQKYETAENKMSAAVLWRLATALGVDVQHLFEGLTVIHAAPAPAAELRSFAGGRDRDEPRAAADDSRAAIRIPSRLNVIAPV